MNVMHKLLDLQACDTRCTQLEYQLSHHSSFELRDQAAASLAEHDQAASACRAARNEVSARQRPIEEQVRVAEQKLTKDNDALYSGAVTGHKELEALQHEMALQRKRISEFEDTLLELMEEAEPLDQQLLAAERARPDLEAQLSAAEQAVLAAVAEIEVELDAELAKRAALAETLPEDLLAQYEGLRKGSGGQGAARLGAGGRCEGCHLTLPRAEYEAAKRSAPGEVFLCPECGRILVRVDNLEAETADAE